MMMFDKFYAERTEFLNRDCRGGTGRGEVYHRACGTRIRVVGATLHVHDQSHEGCVGNGEHFEAGIPYCPKCEPQPAAEGCVHV
jgi:hypothetical protein